MKGRDIVFQPRSGGGHAAALRIDGRLEDLIVDPETTDPTPRPEAIYTAVAGRPMKGQGGMFVDLGGGQRGFLRGPRLPAPGRRILVQVSGWTEPGKAPPVGAQIRLKGHFIILTPGAHGANVSRAIKDPDRRVALAALAQSGLADAGRDLGAVVRSAAETAMPDDVLAEISALCQQWGEVVERANGAPSCLRPGPGAVDLARRDWTDPETPVADEPSAFSHAGLWEDIAALFDPEIALGSASMAIEPTRALVAVDVNTGGDASMAAGLKANLAAARDLPRQLRLRGLGGQVVIDFAPMSRPSRGQVEAALRAALRSDAIDTAIIGWTTLGHLELRRKRARRPLQDLRGRLDPDHPAM